MKLEIPQLNAKKAAALAVSFVTVSFWLIILTYPGFYIFNPFETKIEIFRFLQIFSSVGCLLFATFPILFAWVPVLNGKSTKIPYLVAAIFWPVAILVIQLTLALQGGGFYSYVGRDPIFALNDLIAPVLLILLSSTLFDAKKKKRKKSSKR